MSRFEANADTAKPITPRKARILVLVGAVLLLHAACLLFLWPEHWPKNYKWLLLPDSISAYFVLALGLQQLKGPGNSEHEG